MKEKKKSLPLQLIQSPITIKGTISNPLISFENTINLKITASPSDWKALECFYQEDPESFADEFHLAFIQNALGDITERESIALNKYLKIPEKRLRGRQRNNQFLVVQIKSATGSLYPIFYHFYKQENKLPDFLKRLTERSEKEGNIIYSKNKKTYLNALRSTTYCIRKYYGRAARGRLQLPNDISDSFYVTYIKDNKRVIWVRKQISNFIKKGTPERIVDLVYQFPLLSIFQYLNILSPLKPQSD